MDKEKKIIIMEEAFTVQRILDLNGEKYSVLNWIALLLNHRDFQLNSPIAMEAEKYLTDNFLPDVTCIEMRY